MKNWCWMVPCVLAWVQSSMGQIPTWSQLPNSPSGTTRHDDIWFVDETTGWSARGRGGIFKTADGGNTWVQKLTNTTTHFRCIAFASPLRGWAGNLGPGSYDSSVTDTNVMYETFDGGETWTNRPGFGEAGMRGLCSIYVLGSNNVYGVGRVRGPAYFIKSTDGGTNWTLTNLTAAGVMGAMMDVYFKDPNVGFVVGMSTAPYSGNCNPTYHGRIAKTTDGGQTWTAVATTTYPCCYFWKMSWPTPDIGYVSLQKNPTSSDAIVFYKTTDGGNSWVSNGVPVAAIGVSSFYWQGIGFVNANEGWAGGDSGSAPNNFLHTTDGGNSWTPAGYANTATINRIRFLSPTLGIASGAKLHIYRVPLAISQQPQDQWVLAGADVNFSVVASGNPPFSYQWRKNGTNLSGGTSTSLVLSNVVRADAGSYSVLLTNASGTLLSSNANLRVLAAQYINTPQFTLEGSVRILFSDADGGVLMSNDVSHFEVLASSNLVDWLVLTNALSLTNGMMSLEDSALHPHRFYRVLEQ
jgi:photosystem II stability/assembly factor-like uncharacterized protein